jgi:hypothetical protein
MSAETQKVDVLGSFDGTIERMKNEAAAREREGDLLLRDIYIELAEKETKSRNAVAELIDALKGFVELAEQRELELGTLSPEMNSRLVSGRAALARVGGAA